jgi:putative FmdB family regulatory protein
MICMDDSLTSVETNTRFRESKSHSGQTLNSASDLPRSILRARGAFYSMPTYEYECTKCKRIFEKFQSITAEPLTTCAFEGCGGTVKRLVSGGAGFLFKGSGFYETDYRSESYKKKAQAESSQSGSSTSSTSSSSSASSVTPSASPSSTPAAKPSPSGSST